MENDLWILLAYGIGTFVGIMLCELRFEERVNGVLRDLAEEGFIKHRINDDGEFVFIKSSNKEDK